jgi:hypothetical protein
VSDPTPIIPSFPTHQPPRGIPIAHPKQSGILTKVLGRMLKPPTKAHKTSRVRGRSKGLVSSQTVKITSKKVKFY